MSLGTHYLQSLVQYIIYILMIWATDYWFFKCNLIAKCTLIDSKFWNNSSVTWKRETKCHLKGLVEGEDLTILQGPPHLDPPLTLTSPPITLPCARYLTYTGLLLWLRYARHTPISVSVYLPLTLLGILSLQVPSWLPLSLPSGLYSEVTFLVTYSLASFFKLTSLPSPLILLPFLHIYFAYLFCLLSLYLRAWLHVIHWCIPQGLK